MNRELSARELVYWEAFDSLWPIGDERSEINAALIAATIWNAAGKHLRKGKSISIDDMLYTKPRVKESDNALVKTLAKIPGVKIEHGPSR